MTHLILLSFQLMMMLRRFNSKFSVQVHNAQNFWFVFKESATVVAKNFAKTAFGLAGGRKVLLMRSG